MPIDPRLLTIDERSLYVMKALECANAITATIPNGEAVLARFAELLKFVVESDYCGGCHDSSAVLHMILAEAGIPSTLCIGEVGVGGFFFDHSWVEIDGLIYDAAVCMPHPDGEIVGGPVFGSIDLETELQSHLHFGAESGEGLGDAAQPALRLDLQGYSSVQPDPDIWVLAVAMASRCGDPNATFNGFRSRYGRVRRTLRTGHH